MQFFLKKLPYTYTSFKAIAFESMKTFLIELFVFLK